MPSLITSPKGQCYCPLLLLTISLMGQQSLWSYELSVKALKPLRLTRRSSKISSALNPLKNSLIKEPLCLPILTCLSRPTLLRSSAAWDTCKAYPFRHLKGFSLSYLLGQIVPIFHYHIERLRGPSEGPAALHTHLDWVLLDLTLLPVSPKDPNTASCECNLYPLSWDVLNPVTSLQCREPVANWCSPLSEQQINNQIQAGPWRLNPGCHVS